VKKMMAACALVAIALAGCSKTEGTTSTAGGSSTIAGSSSSSKITKAALIEKADKICAENKAAQKALPTPKADADVEEYLKKVVEQQKEAQKKIKDLGEPDTDADKFNDALTKAQKVIDLFEKKLPEIAKDPSVVDSDKDLKAAGDEADKAAKDFGFKECGKSSSDSGSSDETTTTKKGSGSSDETTTTKKGSGSSDETTTTEKSGSSGGAKLTPQECLDVASANLDLVTANSKDEAEAAAEKLNAFDPPSDVKKAIETFAENGGPDYTDPKTGDYAALITEWMKSICPGLSS
jgi:hypothetical protein